MAAGKHVGKVLIRIRKEEDDLKAKPSLLYMKSEPRVICSASNSYVILGLYWIEILF